MSHTHRVRREHFPHTRIVHMKDSEAAEESARNLRTHGFNADWTGSAVKVTFTADDYIRACAYRRREHRGRPLWDADTDWLEAEREILAT